MSSSSWTMRASSELEAVWLRRRQPTAYAKSRQDRRCRYSLHQHLGNARMLRRRGRPSSASGRYPLRTGVEAAIVDNHIPQTYLSSFEATLPHACCPDAEQDGDGGQVPPRQRERPGGRLRPVDAWFRRLPRQLTTSPRGSTGRLAKSTRAAARLAASSRLVRAAPATSCRTTPYPAAPSAASMHPTSRRPPKAASSAAASLRRARPVAPHRRSRPYSTSSTPTTFGHTRA